MRYEEFVEYMERKKAMEPQFLLSIDYVGPVEVVDFGAEEELSTPYFADISIASMTELTFDVIENEAVLTIKGGVMDRYIHGVIRKLEVAGQEGGKYRYNIQIVPYFRLLSLNKNCRIFQDMNVQDIISQIFDENYIYTDRFEFRFANKERLRKYCVQFNETDMDFIERLLQEEGIFYFFEHYEDKHVMVFGEDMTDYSLLKDGMREIPFMADSGMNVTEECVDLIEFSKRLKSGSFTHTNFNFKMPGVDLEKDKQTEEEAPQKFETYEYPGLYGDIDRGDNLARASLDLQQSFAEQAEGTSSSPRLISGYEFSLIGHDFGPFNKDYAVVEVKHEGTQYQVLEESADGATSYTNSFKAIPSTVNYKPLKTHEKPSMKSPQTATVVGFEGDEIRTDEYGRIKVLFHWDREGKEKKDKMRCSCWVRCAQLWGGESRGALFTPRVGDEVIVDFLNGDPDFPVITGSLYNGANQPPHTLPANKTVSSIKTRSTPNSNGFNELRFDDKAGDEEVFIHAQKDCNITVKNRMGQTIGGDSGTVIGGKCTRKISGDSYCEVGGKSTEIADEIVLSAASKITLVIGSTSIEMTSAGFMTNSPKIDLNNGGGATAPVAEAVSGSLGHSGSGSPPPADKGKSSSGPSSAAGTSGLTQRGTKTNSAPSAPENSQNTPAEDDPEIEDDGWKLGSNSKDIGAIG